MTIKKIGLALSFSPSMQNNLAVALHLKKLYKAELFILHSSSAKKSDKEKLEKALIDSKCDLSTISIIEGSGDPADFILQTIKSQNLDLIVAGALKKENIVKFYIGSVARRIMNEAPCSVFIASVEKKFEKNFNKFCTLVNYTQDCEKAIKLAYELANLDNAEKFYLIKDLWISGLSLTGLDSGNIKESTEIIKQCILEEKEKIKIFIDEINLKGSVPIEINCFYEKVALNLSKYIKEIDADVLVISSKAKKKSILDRFVSDELSYLYDDLPSNLLIFR